MSVDVSTAQSRTIDVLDATGSKAGTVELPSELFDVTANIPLIHQVVVAQLAAARQGTHATKAGARSAAAARSRTVRRAPVAPARARPARRSTSAVARCTDRSRTATPSARPRR
jgi:ribosomal protein L4